MSARSLAVALTFALLLAGCVVRYVTGPKLTGTCDGACAHYERCKGGVAEKTQQACRRECPGVFSDRDSLMAFESLSCEDTVEYIEGPDHRPPGSPLPSSGAALQ